LLINIELWSKKRSCLTSSSSRTPTPEINIVLGEPSRIKAALASLPALSWSQSIWAGVEPLLDPASRKDYILTNARGVFGGLMSEYILGYLLAYERRIFQRLEDQKNKRWDDSDTGTLRGKTIGLLGVGSIGADVARTAKFFGMTVRVDTLSQVRQVLTWTSIITAMIYLIRQRTRLPRQHPPQHKRHPQDHQR
jgi:phosphoglycerate dehydrogenase-like enzyme